MSLATSCQITQGSCVSSEAIFLCTQPQQHCNFLRVHQGNTRIEGSLWIDQCRWMFSEFLHQEILRWHKGGVGMFARRVGNVLQAFSCVPRVAPTMEMDSCFEEIPVWVDGSVQLIDIETLVLKVHGVQEPCNDVLP